MHKPSGRQIGLSQWAAASRATPSTPKRDYVNTRSDLEHGAWEDDGGLLGHEAEVAVGVDYVRY